MSDTFTDNIMWKIVNDLLTQLWLPIMLIFTWDSHIIFWQLTCSMPYGDVSSCGYRGDHISYLWFTTIVTGLVSQEIEGSTLDSKICLLGWSGCSALLRLQFAERITDMLSRHSGRMGREGTVWGQRWWLDLMKANIALVLEWRLEISTPLVDLVSSVPYS